MDYVAINKFDKAYKKIVRSLKGSPFLCLDEKIMGRQNAHEHEAFLAL